MNTFIAIILSFFIASTIHFKVFTDWCFSFKADMKNQVLSFMLLWVIIYRLVILCTKFNV
jgi:hypothetical protein